MKKADFILVAVALLLATAILFINHIYKSNNNENHNIQIQVCNELYGNYSLDENTTFEINSSLGCNIICIEDGAIYVKEANCDNQTCVNMGKKSETGESIVCLPHKLIITIQ